MDFRILGPLEVRDGDREVRLRAGKERALLALLLVNANRTLAIDRIVDDLWGEDVPESAQKMVQIHVSKLRKVLAPGLLHTRPPGYSLQLAPDDVDLHRFERLVAKARTSLDVGRAEEASAGPSRRAARSGGAGRRSRSSRRSRSRRRSGLGSRRFGSPRSRAGSRPISCSGGTASSSGSSKH